MKKSGGGETLQIRRAETLDDLFSTVTGLRHPGGLSLLLTVRRHRAGCVSSLLLGSCRSVVNVFHTYFLRFFTTYRCLHSFLSIEDRIRTFTSSVSPFLSLFLLAAPVLGGWVFLWRRVLRQHLPFSAPDPHGAFHSLGFRARGLVWR